MPTITLDIKYKKNTGLLISTRELKALYLYGVTIGAKDGTDFPDSSLEFYIRSAQEQIERYLSIRFIKTLITQTQHYNRSEYINQFPLIQVDFPINKSLTLVGLLNKIEQIIYPSEWLTQHTSSEGTFRRTLSVVPNGVSTVSGNQDVILLGTTANLGIQRFNTIPNYWTLQYETGFDIDKIPYELINVVGMMAAIPAFDIAGDLILGAGIASQSLGIDGLSQSLSSTSSATNAGYGARIISYQKQSKDILTKLKSVYVGIQFTVM